MSSLRKPGRILIYGVDPMLLRTRRMILEQRGFVVETTREATTMRARMESDGYDLLVVCHTVPESEQRQIANAETRAQYLLQVPVMLLPTEFLNKVHQLVNRP